jgi:VanZ family protein
MSGFMPAEKEGTFEARTGFSPHSVRLAWILAVAYLLVVVYASIQPFHSGWVASEGFLAFLFQPWPRYVTLQDVVVNIAAYVPLGFLLSIGWSARWGAARGAAAAVAAAAALSFAMEAMQMYLPARIASSVDLLANGIGALIGALAAPLFAPAHILGGKLHALRHRLFLEGMTADAGLVVVGLWVAAQFHPDAQLFGTGDVRATLDLPTWFEHSAWLALSGEGVVVTFNLLGAALLLSACARAGQRPLRVVGAAVGAALLIKVFTAAAIVRAPAPLAWLTPGVLLGLFAGGLLALAAVRLPQRTQIAVSAVCITIATVAINLAPVNPYLRPPSRLLVGGTSHFLSFSGIVQALSELWPLLAVGYLVYAFGASGSGGSRRI